MKKMFTLFTAILLTTAMFAADRRPVIKLDNNSNFKVVIDGRSYFGDNVRIDPDHFFRGQHTVRIYEMKRGFFGRFERLVNTSTFYMDGHDDIMIRVDRRGDIFIKEESKGWKNNRGRGFDDRDRNGTIPRRY